MGESIADLPKSADKMGETATSNSVLEVSVSFGRFESDSLSWEKWSAFSPNKYLEEVEKCATPGSVAQKKAYFEAHYKKIAARKAELLEREKQAQNDPMKLEDPNGRDLVGSNGETHVNFDASKESSSAKFDVSKEPSSAKFDVSEEPSLAKFDVYEDPNSEEENDQEINLISEMGISNMDDQKEEAVMDKEHQSLEMEREEEDDSRGITSSILSKPEEVFSVKEVDSISIESQSRKEASKTLENEFGYNSQVKEAKKKMVSKNEYKKVTPVSKEKNVAKPTKKPASISPQQKKIASPTTRTPKSSTPRVSKPISSSSRISSSTLSSAKKSITPSLTRSNNPSAVETKEVTPKSLPMSLSLGPTNSDSSSLTTSGKSLIMEKMGDKDIVKRAFKAFQKNFDQVKSASEDRSLLQKQVQVSTKRTEPKVSSFVTPKKEQGGSLKTDRLDKRSAKSPPSFVLKSDERADKRKEFTKKLEEKSNAREAERPRLQSKSKEEKEADCKKLRQNLNSRATPMPTFYRGQRMSKSTSDK
ncbi:hypothetical protein UlMin_040377, partial [Ulmus minor]